MMILAYLSNGFSLKRYAIFLACLFLISSCKKEEDIKQTPPNGSNPLELPSYFPPMIIPDDNRINLMKIQLGKKLFFDPNLSKNRDISCATCHLPQRAFTDGHTVSIGDEGRKTMRNAPSLLNIGFHPYFFLDGGNPRLESQLLGPIENENEMNLPFDSAVQRIAKDSSYLYMFERIFNQGASAYTISRAIATYERSLVSYNSPFDRYYYQGDSSAVTEKVKQGFALFKSAKLKCNECHKGVLFTDFSFQNNGLKAIYNEDKGRANITLNPEDEGKFKVATMRNIALTAPYMHDGSLATLEAVIDHYARGGSKHINQSKDIVGFEISPQEKKALIAFLESLSDTSSWKKLTFSP